MHFLSFLLLLKYISDLQLSLTNNCDHMKEKILAFLKTKLTGVPESYLEGVAETYSKTITGESQFETTFTDGVIVALKNSATEIQKEGDRRANDATKSAVTNYEKKHNLKDGKPVKKEEPTKVDLNDPKGIESIVAKAVDAAVKPLQDKLNAKEQAENQSTLRQHVIDKMTEGKSDADVKLMKSWLDGRTINIEKEEDIENVATSVGEKFNTHKQTLVDEGVIVDVPRDPDGYGGKEDEFINTMKEINKSDD